jgi:hypothetical protein
MTNASAHLVERMVYNGVSDCVDFDELWALREQLAVDLGRLPGVPDAELLAVPRKLIAGALRRLADEEESGSYDDDRELRIRYENALGAEAIAELDAG